MLSYTALVLNSRLRYFELALATSGAYSAFLSHIPLTSDISCIWWFVLDSRRIVSLWILVEAISHCFFYRTGAWMRMENRKRNKLQGGANITAADIHTEVLGEGHKSPSFRYMY